MDIFLIVKITLYGTILNQKRSQITRPIQIYKPDIRRFLKKLISSTKLYPHLLQHLFIHYFAITEFLGEVIIEELFSITSSGREVLRLINQLSDDKI